jgi:two-component system response regulator BaeR
MRANRGAIVSERPVAQERHAPTAPDAGAARGHARPILVVEDEPALAALLADTLRGDGYTVEVAGDGRGVADWVRAHEPQAVLLDLTLPGKDGIEVCREIRAFSTVPLIMITARVAEIDRLLGLETGADDYVCKPFGAREVLARVRALLRRAGTWAETAARGLMLDDEAMEARWRGRRLDLTPVEFRLLRALAQRPGRVLSRGQLLDAIHSDYRAVSDRTVDSHVKNLRRKLGEGSCADPIESVYGVGYKFVPEA